MQVDWRGVFPALMTEFTEDGALDLEATQRHIAACLDAGIEGLVMLGTLGENSSLTPDEKETVCRAAHGMALSRRGGASCTWRNASLSSAAMPRAKSAG